MTDQDSNSTKDDVIVDYYTRLPGPCGECCLKFPCLSILACAMMIAGDVLLLAGFHLGAEEVQVLFAGTPVSGPFTETFSRIQVVIYCLSAFMAIVAVVLLAVSCLATGATRSVYLCRFKTRRSGRCQTALFLMISYFLFLGFLTATVFAVVPVFFMYVVNRGVCLGVEANQETCLNLVQWGLLSPNTPVGLNDELICGTKMTNICESDLMLFFSFAFLGCLLMLLASVQFAMNMSANFAQLLDRYKRAYVTGTAGSYNMRSGVRDIMMRGSKRSTNTRLQPGGTRTNVQLTRAGGTGNGAYNDSVVRYGDAAVEPERYSSLEMTSLSRREEPPPPNPPPNPPPYLPSSREPLANLQHRARSFDPLDYNDYAGRLDTNRSKGMSRSAEPIDFGERYDRYDRYNEFS